MKTIADIDENWNAPKDFNYLSRRFLISAQYKHMKYA